MISSTEWARWCRAQVEDLDRFHDAAENDGCRGPIRLDGVDDRKSSGVVVDAGADLGRTRPLRRQRCVVIVANASEAGFAR
jgi:hypothetical protein